MKSLILLFLCFLFLLSRRKRLEVIASLTDYEISDRVVGGNESEPHQWSWLVALVDVGTAKFFCGGSLISAYHVLSAAHCFNEKGSYDVRDKDDVNAYLGKHNLSDIFEPESETSSVSEIYMHPDWNFRDYKYDADIAVLLLFRKIEFSKTIKPIALPPKITNDDDEVEVIGFVVGWGLTDPDNPDEVVEIPSEVMIPAINGTFCFKTFWDLADIASPSSFCAGFQNKTISACNGDSGGGFYVRNSMTRAFDVRGIVSAGLMNDEGVCDANKFTLYTVVGKFVDWIKGKMEEREKIETKIDKFSCGEWWSNEFFYNGPDFLYCKPVDTAGRQTSFRGQFNIDPEHRRHLNSTTEVRGLQISWGKSSNHSHVPIGIGKSFPNLERLFVTNNVTTTAPVHIRREYFVEMEKLTRLQISLRRIKPLPENFLWDLRSLEHLSIGADGLLYYQRSALRLPDNIFSKSKKLKRIDLNSPLISLNKKHLQGLDDLRNFRFWTWDDQSLDENLFANHRQLEELRIDVLKGVLPEQLLSELFGLKMLELRFWDVNQQLNFLPTLNHTKLLRYLSLKTPYRPNSDHFCGSSLEILSLLGSMIIDLPGKYFEHLKTLKILDLSDCMISSVSKDAFKSLELLIGLDLSQNEIESLPERVFKPLINLKVLRLQGNLLETVDPKMFEFDRNIKAVVFFCGRLSFDDLSEYYGDDASFCNFKIETTNGSIDFTSSAPVGTILIAGVGRRLYVKQP